MSIKLTTVTAGRTKELGPFTLRIDGQPYNLTGHQVELKLRSTASSTYYDTAGDVRIDADQTTNRGKVYFKPDAEDFNKPGTRFFLKWKVTDGNNDIVHFPEDEADYIDVVQA